MPGQFNYLNMNPLGLNTNDCVIRGISLLMNQSWEWTYFMICLQGFLMYQMPSTNDVWSLYLYNNSNDAGTIQSAELYGSDVSAVYRKIIG